MLVLGQGREGDVWAFAEMRHAGSQSEIMACNESHSALFRMRSRPTAHHGSAPNCATSVPPPFAAATPDMLQIISADRHQQYAKRVQWRGTASLGRSVAQPRKQQRASPVRHHARARATVRYHLQVQTWRQRSSVSPSLEQGCPCTCRHQPVALHGIGEPHNRADRTLVQTSRQRSLGARVRLGRRTRLSPPVRATLHQRHATSSLVRH